MLSIKARIIPLSAFGSLAKGDTMFGQLCWAVRNRFGEHRLRELLDGYTANRPYAVVSDAFPAGFFPRPALPGHWFAALSDINRKDVKKRTWLPAERFAEPVESWLIHFRKLTEHPRMRPQPHNVIDRRTGTTGEDFAPFSTTQHWYVTRDSEAVSDGGSLDVHVVLDDTRLAVPELEQLLNDIGTFGFGRDASIGLGKFRIDSIEQEMPPIQDNCNSWLTLAPCAPQSCGFDPARSFYQVFTRFGRHGDVAVHTGRPFKAPVLLAQTGAVLTPVSRKPRLLVGQGLGGDGTLSKAIPATVHQGYAPALGIRLPRRGETAS